MRIDKQKLNVILAEKGLTIGDAAKKAGLSRGRYTLIINSESVRPKTAGKIAKGLGVKIEEIIDIEEYKNG